MKIDTPHSMESWTSPTKGSKKTKLEKTLIVVSVLLIAAVIGLLIGLIVVLTAPPPEVPPADNICYTETCIDRSLWIMRAVDNTTDPCEDFYQYACGKWLAENEIPPDRSGISTTGSIRDDLDKLLNKSLSLRTVNPSEVNDNAQNKAALLYQRCLESDKIDESRIYNALTEIVKNVGGCGLLTPNWSEDKRELSDIIATIQAVTQDSFLSISVEPDTRNSSRNRITIGEPKLLLKLKALYKDNSELYTAYQNLVRDVFKLLHQKVNGDLSISSLEEQLEELLNFENSLADALTSIQLRKITHVPKQDLSEFYGNLLSTLVKDLVGQTIDPSEQIQLVNGEEFLANYETFLKAAPIRAITNYGIWTLISNELFEGLPSSLRDLKADFMFNLQGSTLPIRWEACLSVDTKYLENGIGRLYIDNHNDKTLKDDASALVETIALEFKRTSLEQSDWIDEQTKKRAVNKLNLMGREIAYSDIVANDAKLNAYYAGIILPTASDALFIDFLHKAARGSTVDKMNLWVAREVDRSDWGFGPQTVNAFYSASANSIYLPAGFLYPPFYSGDLPSAMNYGGIGQVIGHEIGHGFDNTGRLYDENGNMENWWTNESIAAFNSRAQCLVDQYSTKCHPEIPEPNCIDGQQTLGENIADNSGLRASYEAYVEWKKTHADLKLPGLTYYTDEQLLFLNFAHLLCSKLTPQELKRRLIIDSHSTLPHRVNANLESIDQFSQAWKCKAGSKMNLPPEKECRVW